MRTRGTSSNEGCFTTVGGSTAIPLSEHSVMVCSLGLTCVRVRVYTYHMHTCVHVHVCTRTHRGKQEVASWQLMRHVTSLKPRGVEVPAARQLPQPSPLRFHPRLTAPAPWLYSPEPSHNPQAPCLLLLPRKKRADLGTDHLNLTLFGLRKTAKYTSKP